MQASRTVTGVALDWILQRHPSLVTKCHRKNVADITRELAHQSHGRQGRQLHGGV